MDCAIPSEVNGTLSHRALVRAKPRTYCARRAKRRFAAACAEAVGFGGFKVPRRGVLNRGSARAVAQTVFLTAIQYC